ncbi:putative nuclease HARBI1 [Temnothorax longispinosus]|uniref:putative nuclease HARBI1 n=1 Tax=Temnothorax longispinosus TaxID=300112 RepID=UPI003A9A61E0
MYIAEMLPEHILNALFLAEIEEDRRQDILTYRNKRHLLRDVSDPFAMCESQFIELFRLNKGMVQYLIEELRPHMSVPAHGRSVAPELKILAVLHFYATGSYQRSIGQNFLFPIAQSTMSGYVAMVTYLICRHLGQRWIVFPTDRRVIEEKKRTFLQSFGFPGTIGAIDGTHIALITPAEEEHNYLNRKGFHSKNVQIICDADLNILNVNPRHAGATHDSYIWRNSAILEHLRNNYEHGDTDTWLIGDSGYPQQPWLMTPIVNAQPNTPDSRYTDALVKARCCVERCIGTLKSRFRCILKERMLRYSPLSVGRIIVACSVLHNICNGGRLDVLNDIHPEGVQENNVQENMQEEDLASGQQARQRLINLHFQ